MPVPCAGIPPPPNPPSKARTMKLTIFGATGATGTILTKQALASRPFGHSRRPRPGPPGRPAPAAAGGRHRRCPGPSLDQPGRHRRRRHTDRCSPTGTGPSTLRQDSARSIIQAMQETGPVGCSRSVVPSSPTKAKAPTCATCSSPWYGARSSATCAPTCAAARMRYTPATWTGRSSARRRSPTNPQGNLPHRGRPQPATLLQHLPR